jgi:hypothetical protein
MTSATKIADMMIADSRGILSKPHKPAPDTITLTVCPSGYVIPHVMPIETYRARFGAQTGEK